MQSNNGMFLGTIRLNGLKSMVPSNLQKNPAGSGAKKELWFIPPEKQGLYEDVASSILLNSTY